jgi:hypothetical protein
MSCRPLIVSSTETVFPIRLSPPRSMPSMSRILPYGSRGDVKSDDSHPAYIYPRACVWLMYVPFDHGYWYLTLRHHAMPRSTLFCRYRWRRHCSAIVGPMWDLSYITLCYGILGPSVIRLSTASSAWRISVDGGRRSPTASRF